MNLPNPAGTVVLESSTEALSTTTSPIDVRYITEAEALQKQKKRFDHSLCRKASLNSMAAGLDYGARVLVGFVVTPLLVAGLGAYGFGAWQVLGRLVGYIGPASGRTGSALRVKIAHDQSSTDFDEKRRCVGSALCVWFIFLPILTGLALPLAWWSPALVQTPASLIWTIRVTALLLAVNVLVINIGKIPRAVLVGENLGYKRLGLSTALVCLGGGLNALAVYLDFGLIGVAAATLLTSCLTGVFFLSVARAHVDWFGIARPSWQAIRRFFGFSWWFLVWRLVMQLFRSSDFVVLGLFAAVELVTIYALTKYAPETVISFVAIIVTGITPGLGGIIGSGNLPKAARVRGEIMLLTWLVAIVVGTTMLLWNRAFVQLWVGAEYYAGFFPNACIMLMVMQFVLIRNDAQIIDLTLKVRNKVLIGALSALMAIVLAGILVGVFNAGITGLCLGFIAGRSILSVVYPSMVGRILGIPLLFQIESIVRPGCASILLFGLIPVVGRWFTANTWHGLTLSVGVTFVLVFVFAFYAGLSRDQRSRIVRRMRPLLNFRSESN